MNPFSHRSTKWCSKIVRCGKNVYVKVSAVFLLLKSNEIKNKKGKPENEQSALIGLKNVDNNSETFFGPLRVP